MSTDSFSFGTLYDSTAAAGGEHWGHIECHCGHHHDETLAEARTGGRIHLNGDCLWSCCHANWSDFTCTAPISKVGGGKSSSSQSVMSQELPKEEENPDQKKFVRFLPTFFTQELICLSCFKPYREPLKLPCGHTFCRECIEKLVSYQRAAGSFLARFRPAPPQEESEGKSSKDSIDGNLRLRQMSRSQRHALLDDAKKQQEKMKDEDDKVNKDFVMCPVCSICSYVRLAVPDEETIQKMKELAEQRQKGVRPKCSFCTSAVLAGAQAGEATDATLVCSTCGPICDRHHALLHIAGPPTFRTHQVNETPMDLLPLNVIPHSYQICPKHGCEMDLFDKSRDVPMCEVCVAALSKNDISSRIIREEDKMAYLMEKEAKKAREEDAKNQEKKSEQQREEERKRSEIDQIGELHKGLEEEMAKCHEAMDKSRGLFETGALTKNVKGLDDIREQVRKVFADSHKALEDMQKQAEDDISKMIDDADHLLESRYEASRTLLEGAAEASARAVSVSLESKDVRLMVIKRLKQLQEQLKSIESLPNEELEVSALFTFEKPETVDKLHLVRIQQNDKGLFASSPAGKVEEAPEEPVKEVVEEDENAILERIRARLKDELKKDPSRRSRDDRRFGSIRSAVSSSMSDGMKSEAIGSIIFERAMEVLNVDFEAVFEISAKFFEKNSVDHIMSNLSSPSEFNLELRAIYELLKETHKLS